MEVRRVDPRDIGWEIETPTYRVYFWARPQAPSGIPQHLVMWRADEFEVTNVKDVTEVLAWAQATATPRTTYTVYVVVEHTGERGLVQLAGEYPPRGSTK